MTHKEKHPRAGETVKVQFTGGHPQIPGSATTPVDITIEDWWDKLTGKSWMFSGGNPACIVYAIRGGVNQLPTDDDVFYGKSEQGFGHLVHSSEVVS
jgi:hypothetical protein